MRHLFFVFIVFVMCNIAISTNAAQSKLLDMVKEWTPEGVKQALLNNPRLTQKQLNEALFDALQRSKSDYIVKLLLDAGANPNAEPEIPTNLKYELAKEDYWKPIQHAAVFGELDGNWNSFISLANAGAVMEGDLGEDGYDPPTLTHFVALHGNDEAVKAMVKRGIDKRMRDYVNDLTPYDYAKKNKNLSPSIREMLR